MAHALLWQIAACELGAYHDSALFDALCLAMALPQLPAAAACVSASAGRYDHSAALGAQRSGSVAEGALNLERSLLGAIALFLEAK